ncbi:IS3 family transposase (plasmid) [Rahnella aquatilis]|nr:IS3 family transposase [Rahnella aquatilis]
MRKIRFTEHQIIAVLKSVEAGRTVKDVCREAAISEASYYNWKAKYGGMEAADIKKIKDLEDENRRLKQMFAELSLECRALKDVIEKMYGSPPFCKHTMIFRRKGKQRLPVRNPAPLATPEALNQSWSIDFMHDALTCGRRFRTFNVVDDFNRETLAIEIDLNIPAQRVVRVLGRIVANRGYPLKMRMDNGPELISLALAQWAEDHGVMLEFIKPGKPTQNAFIERFNRIYRTEILDFYLFITLNEVREITERWLNEYNSERPHESLNNLTPEEYRLMAEKPEISKSVWN